MMRENLKRGSDKKEEALCIPSKMTSEGKRVSVTGARREDEDNLPSVVYDMCGTLAP